MTMAKKNLITGKKTRKPSTDEAELVALKLELAQAKQQLAAAQGKAKNTIKVSKKGCVSVYGMGRFPISFYKSQWRRLFAMKDDIEAFIAEHEDLLPEKKDKASK
jgi:hypothetical protein